LSDTLGPVPLSDTLGPVQAPLNLLLRLHFGYMYQHQIHPIQWCLQNNQTTFLAKISFTLLSFASLQYNYPVVGMHSNFFKVGRHFNNIITLLVWVLILFEEMQIIR
jgi:hypothetical protein